MATYLVSLQWLTGAEQHASGSEEADCGAHEPTATPAAPQIDVAEEISESAEPAPDAKPPLAAAGDESDDGQVLGLSHDELDDLAARFGQSGGRALLALIYRLSSIESELAALRSLIERGAAGQAAPANSSDTRDNQAGSQSAGDDPLGLLEQVFKSNLALWISMD